MTEDDAVELAIWLSDMPQFKHYQRDAGTYRVFAEELEDLPVSFDQAKHACRSLLAGDDQRFPNPQAIRRRFLEEAGLLAPPMSLAMAAIERVAADPEGRERHLPGPAAAAVRAWGGLGTLRMSSNPTAAFAQIRDLYKELAYEHDRLVLAPGGVQAFMDACEVWAAHWDRLDVRERAWHAARFIEPEFWPADHDQCLQVLDRYEAQWGEPASLAKDPTEGPPMVGGARRAMERLMALAAATAKEPGDADSD